MKLLNAVVLACALLPFAGCAADDEDILDNGESDDAVVDVEPLYGIRLTYVELSTLNNDKSWDPFSGRPDPILCVNDDIEQCTDVLCDDSRRCDQEGMVLAPVLVDEVDEEYEYQPIRLTLEELESAVLGVYDEDGGLSPDEAGEAPLLSLIPDWSFDLDLELARSGESESFTAPPFNPDGVGADTGRMDVEAGVKSLSFDIVLLREGSGIYAAE